MKMLRIQILSWARFSTSPAAGRAIRRIIIRSRAHDIELAIGSQTALVDGGKRLMEQAPILDERTGRTLVPLRFIAQTMGHAVLWDGKRRKIIILK